MSDVYSGMFFCRNLKARQYDGKDAFCKPIKIRVYSAPAPVRMRVVTYEMVFWPGVTQPSTADQWAQDRAYQSPFNNHHTFSFTLGTLALSQDALMTEIRRHFYSVVLQGMGCRTATEAFNRLDKMNTGVWSGGDAQSPFEVGKIHHIWALDVTEDWSHSTTKDVIKYRGWRTDQDWPPYGDKYIQVHETYVAPKDLIAAARAHFAVPELQERVRLNLTA